MDSNSVYGLELLVLEGTGGKVIATDHSVNLTVCKKHAGEQWKEQVVMITVHKFSYMIGLVSIKV